MALSRNRELFKVGGFSEGKTTKVLFDVTTMLLNIDSQDQNNETGYEYYDENDAYYLEIYPFETLALGLMRPIIILLTIVTNVFVAGFFFARDRRGKATNLLFIGIAFSDTMTGLALLPNSLYVYAHNRTFLTKEWCKTYMHLRLYVSMVFHTVSIWQTVLLGIQRYLCVRHPFISGRICTFWKTFVSIVIMYCLAIILHIYHLLNNNVGHFRCEWRIEDNPCKMSCMYLWFCVIFQHFTPCVLLLWLTVVTLLKLQQAHKKASFMSASTSQRRSSRDRIITVTSTLIVICFLIPEFPHGVYKLVFVFFKHFDKNIEPFEHHVIIATYEIALLLSFQANFWIYCAMMNDFRQTFFKIITCGLIKHDTRHWSVSLSSRKDSVRTTLSSSNSLANRNRILSRTTSVHSTTSENIHTVIVPLSSSCFDVKKNNLDVKCALPSNQSNECNTYARHVLRSVSIENHDDLNDDVFI